MRFAIVIPTVGRPSLLDLLGSLAKCRGPQPQTIVLVDDRPDPETPLLDESEVGGWPGRVLRICRSGGRGPAAARNVGWRSVDTDWVVFLDDDVRPASSWLRRLAGDLAEATADVGAVAGEIRVPFAAHRRPTDWERSTAGLASATWITADIAYRRSVLREVGGFDERFRRAFREDADLGLRTVAAGYRITQGKRCTDHPVRPAPWWVSITMQRGNADDALMRALHGAHWHDRANAPVGRRARHLATTTAGLTALGAALARRKPLSWLAAAGWLAGTAEFAWARIKPGPRDPAEIASMIVTSVAIPPVASWYWLTGRLRYRHTQPWHADAQRPIAAVLLDRDGTIVRDVPYNGEPQLVEPMPGARAALDRLRAAGIKLGVITNQSGVARGRLTMPQVSAVNARVDELLGPFGDWQVCPHGDEDGCSCRKPQPGMVRAAAQRLGVPVERCVVVGDTGADVAAAQAAGAAAVLIPNEVTRPEEIAAAPAVFARLDDAVTALLGNAEAAS